MNNCIKWIRHIISKIKDDHVSAYAAQATFFTFLSAVPFLMFLLTLLKYVPLDEVMLQENLSAFLPTGIAATINTIIVEVNDKTSGTLLSITIIVLLWTAGKGILALTRGLNTVHGIKETRNYFAVRLLCTFYTFVFAIMLIFTLGFLVFGNHIFAWLCHYFPLLEKTAHLIISARTIVSMGILTYIFLVFYKVLPNKKCKLKRQLPGAVFAALGWLCCSYFFSVYISYSVNLSYMYGSLAGIIVAMLWLYFCMFIFFIGAEINQLTKNEAGTI